MKCRNCNNEIEPENIFQQYKEGDCQCDDCFDNMMEQEDKDISVFNSQKGKCCKCNNELSGWIVKEGKAFCWPDCESRTPVLTITKGHLIL